MKTLFTSHKLPLDKCPLGLQMNLRGWQALNPEYTFKYFDDSQMDRWMEENTEPETFQLYNKLNKGAGRADIFRMCFVYVEGGIWVDADLPAFKITNLIPHFSHLLEENKAVITSRNKGIGPRMVFFGGVAKNSLFKKMVSEQKRSITAGLKGIFKEPNNRGGVPSLKTATKSHHEWNDHHLKNITGPWVWNDVVTQACNIKNFGQHKPNFKYIFNGGSLVIIHCTISDEGYRYTGYHDDLAEMGVEKWWLQSPFEESTT